MIAVALYQPEIPQNTGNIGRLAVGFKIPLYLIKPLGFKISEKKLKRAGLDYWTKLNYYIYENFQSFFNSHLKQRIICLSKLGEKELSKFKFNKNDILLMGQETKGIPHLLTTQYKIERIKIPIVGPIRSYNLANATAMAIYEAHRQLNWK